MRRPNAPIDSEGILVESTRRKTASMEQLRGPRGARGWLLHAALPLLCGGLLYIGWRSRDLLFWDWARDLGIASALDRVRDSLGVLGNPPEWLRFSVPDALWVYALTWSVARLQRESRPIVRIAWLSIPALLGPGAELAQVIHVVPGTFDPIDLGATALAFGLGLW